MYRVGSEVRPSSAVGAVASAAKTCWVPSASVRVTFDEGLPVVGGRDQDLVAVDDALEALAKIDERNSKVVELRFFGGMTIEETAAVVGSSPATIKREWAIAKGWLHRALTPARERPAPS